MPLSQSVATERTIIRPICLKPPLNGVVSLKVVSFLLLLNQDKLDFNISTFVMQFKMLARLMLDEKVLSLIVIVIVV